MTITKQYKYDEAIWNEQNQESYWDGVKNGVLIGVIGTLVLVVNGIHTIYKIKESKK